MQRLRSEIERIGVSELARKAGVARNSLYNWSEKGNIPMDKLFLLAEYGVNVDYILNGQSQDATGSAMDEFGLIPVREDIEVSAGAGAFVGMEDSSAYCMAFRKDWLNSRGLKEKDLYVVFTRGDSMEPTISDQDSLLVNTAEKMPHDGHIYVIRSQDTLWVKRIQKLLNGSLLLISDNKIYPPMELNLNEASDVEIIGKVVSSSKNFY
ncbi:XRE family transcriptional regulator [Acinetobacter chinensis]|jgi:phage repressor protein C with HTH and peptisase S24 domain|uniref:XRE family transcriptional regulator n=1 Tax=Acinetobacter chinensis TaxID=2004650 RepID=UPI0029347604|nr:LexA family transcriptional regulator [Acinetobacter chinensis]WOE43157.1 LexA family transcriptional regulator [Acinetobacter chinensis]